VADILDLVSSTIIGGMMFLIITTANDIAAETTSTYNGDALVQEMLITQAQCMEGEFRNMGYGIPPGQQTILSASDSAIVFLSDLNRDGLIDTVRYWVGPTWELLSTQNEYDCLLHRQINNEHELAIGTVTTFILRYITTTGALLPTPVASDQLTEIHEVELTMEVQDPYAMTRQAGQVGAGERSALYSSSYWQQTRLASQNLRR
jgi:hypothetical protein